MTLRTIAGREVSKICLGTMTWGQQNTESEAHEQISYALDRGINMLDAAEMYPVPPRAETQGRTEEYIGTWFKKTGLRDNYVLATKAAGPNPEFHYLRGGPRFTKDQLIKAVDGSLRRLQTDCIDLYQLHWPDRYTNFFGQRGYFHREQPETPIEETLRALEDIVQSGKVRTIGLSNETPWGTMKFLELADREGLPRIESIQNPYSLLNRTYEIAMAEVSQREDVGLLAYSPLGMGLLTGKYRNGAKPENSRMVVFERFTRYEGAETWEAAERYLQLADDHDINPTHMALAFVNTRPFVVSNIIGATTMDQLKMNIDSLDVVLSKELLKGIEAIQQAIPNPAP
jgi:aryl-alcohol dehydrogenase-like predicted oxidoreductase